MFRRTKQGAIEVLQASVPLVRDSRPDFDDVAESCLNNGPGLVLVDMQDVSLIDSDGLEALVELQDRCLKRGGVMKLGAPTQLCRDILAVTGVDEQIEVFPDMVSAVGSFAE